MNDKIKNIEEKVLSDAHFTLKELSFEYLNLDNKWEEQKREVFNRGDGVVALLYNKVNKEILLTEQFRMPVYQNTKEDAMLWEACAGMLDDNVPTTAVLKEIEEETGYRLKETDLEKIYEAYSSPGAVTEKLHYFIGLYTEDQKVSNGGGAADETENIILHRLSLDEALQLLKNGRIKDAKTIILLQYAQLHFA